MSQITASCRRYSADLPQGGLEIPCLLKFEGDVKYVAKAEKLIKYALSTSTTRNENEPTKKKKKLENATDVNSSPETESIVCGRNLSDLHINFAQQVLKKQFPKLGGLQSILLQSKEQVKEAVKNQIQVIHSREDHWIVASTVRSKNGVECVYDSVYTSIDKTTTEVIGNLFGSTTIEMMDTQKQEGSIDCGLFAIAIATGIAFGANSLKFYQKEMRAHLVKCFNDGVMSLFPTMNRITIVIVCK